VKHTNIHEKKLAPSDHVDHSVTTSTIISSSVSGAGCRWWVSDVRKVCKKICAYFSFRVSTRVNLCAHEWSDTRTAIVFNLTIPFISMYKVPNSVPFVLGRVMSTGSLIGSPAAKDVTARH
jgi:hypothetical protein